MKTQELLLKENRVSVRKIEEIDNEISSLEQKLKSVKGTETEVYTRIVGYHRSVSNWNNGKREEYDDRVTFKVDSTQVKEKTKKISKNIIQENESFITKNYNSSDVVFYKVFHSQFCRNCPPVLEFVKSLPIPGEDIDVSTDLGLNSARKYNIMSTPSLVLFDNEDKVLSVLNSLEQIKEVFGESLEEVVSA